MTAHCTIAVDAPCFQGHFPTYPLLPGVSQLQLLVQLIQRQTAWPSLLVGGSGIKYLRPILPGERLQLQLQRDESDKVLFKLSSQEGEKSKGTLQLAGGGT